MKYDLEERTAIFGEKIVELSKKTPKNIVTAPIISQLIRSGTSIGANYAEANGASSKKDFKNKIHICKKESKETQYWLRLLAKAENKVEDDCRKLWKESQELTLILSEQRAEIDDFDVVLSTLRSHEAKILNYSSTLGGDGNRQICHIRLKPCQIKPIIQDMEKLGVKPETVKSDPLKAQPNPMEPFSPDARLMIEGVIEDMHDIFVGLVTDRRSLDREEARKLADGRVFTGRQALQVGLIDAIGDERDARQWLVESAGIDAGLPISDVTPHSGIEEWRDAFTAIFGKVLFSERLRLDGILALWHPHLNL